MTTRISHQAAAVVTGAGSGIGRAFALELARRGGQVICADLRGDSADATAQAIRAAGGEAWGVTCDVRAQLDAQLIWRLKRLAPALYAKGAGWIGRRIDAKARPPVPPSAVTQ